MRRHLLRSTPGQGHSPRPRGRCANCETLQGPFVAVVGFPPLRVCKPTRRQTMVAMAVPECKRRRDALDRERYEPAMRR
jgi:hypothetical protein